MFLVLHILAIVALILVAPASLTDPGATEFLFLLGVVGAWRYSWSFLHLVRSLVFRSLVFGRLRRRADALLRAQREALAARAGLIDVGDDVNTREAPLRSVAAGVAADLDPREVFVIVTSYWIRAETTALAYRRLVEEAMTLERPVTIIASCMEIADERLIKQVFYKLAPPERIRLLMMRQSGAGKRVAIGAALRAVSRQRPHPDAVLVLMDGDTIVAPQTFQMCLPFFDLMPRLGGLTTDEDCVVEGSPALTSWHRLRFAQRHLLMSSLALSRKLLVMTGRMSMFRCRYALDAEFIRMMEADEIRHWRFGRLKLLTGEDKSTWMWLLQRDVDMLYVPDVRVVTMERPPQPGFFAATTQLMVRWFGNMVRSSGRALALGPSRVGPFVWWCLVDQRISMWTPLIGPIVAVMLAIQFGPLILLTYLIWVMITRLVLTLMLLTVRPVIDGTWPWLIYYNQIYGSLVKTWMLFRLDRQRWTRQNIAGQPLQKSRHGLVRLESDYLHALALIALMTAVAAATGLLPLSLFTARF